MDPCHPEPASRRSLPISSSTTWESHKTRRIPRASPPTSSTRVWAGFLQNAGYSEDVYQAEWGKHKVPTLRNVGKGSRQADPADPNCIVKAYGHNGYFKSLAEIVHFYNTRDVLEECEEIGDPQPGVNCWPEPEVEMNVNTDELGDLGLTPEEEAALVAFLMTLSDGYQP